MTTEEDGMAKRRVTAMLEEDDISALMAIARSRRVSLAWVIRDAVRLYLDNGQMPDSNLGKSSDARPGR